MGAGGADVGGVASQVAASARKRTAEESDEAEEEWRRRGAELVGEREGGGRGASVSDKVRACVRRCMLNT